MNHKKTNEEFLELVKMFVGESYTPLEDYVDYVTKIKIKHIKCNYEWYISPNNLIIKKNKGKTICPKCNNKIPYNTDSFREKVKDIVGDEYQVEGEYKNNKTKMVFKHNKCGYSWNLEPEKFTNKDVRCPKCHGNARYTSIEFAELVRIQHDGEYKFIDDYVNNRTSVKLMHKECGTKFSVTPSSFLNGNSKCPICYPTYRISTGEQKIEKYLIINKLYFGRQYSFDDCRHKGTLFFDFAILDEQDNVQYLIEFDGKQHFKPINFFGGNETHNGVKIRDEIKNEYCKINNIELIRIPYWDFDNINEILDKAIV